LCFIIEQIGCLCNAGVASYIKFEYKTPVLIDDFCSYYQSHENKTVIYLLINQGFADKQCLMPFFNRSNNPDLILVIPLAGVCRGRNGFRKDKSAKNSPRAKKTSSNTAPTAPTLSVYL